MNEQQILEKLRTALTPYLEGLDMETLSTHNRSYMRYSDQRFENFVVQEWPYYKKVISWYQQHKNPGATVLDIGTFVPVIPLVLSWLGFKVTTIEKLSLYKGALDCVKQVLAEHNVNFVDADVLEHKFDQRFDYVNFLAVAEHLNGALRQLLEQIRADVLAPEGRFVFVVPNHARLINRLKLLAGISVHPPFADYWASAYPFAGHNREYTFSESVYALEQGGFEVEVVEPVHYAITPSARGVIQLFARFLPKGCASVVFAVATHAPSK